MAIKVNEFDRAKEALEKIKSCKHELGNAKLRVERAESELEKAELAFEEARNELHKAHPEMSK